MLRHTIAKWLVPDVFEENKLLKKDNTHIQNNLKKVIDKKNTLSAANFRMHTRMVALKKDLVAQKNENISLHEKVHMLEAETRELNEMLPILFSSYWNSLSEESQYICQILAKGSSVPLQHFINAMDVDSNSINFSIESLRNHNTLVHSKADSNENIMIQLSSKRFKDFVVCQEEVDYDMCSTSTLVDISTDHCEIPVQVMKNKGGFYSIKIE